MTQVVIPTGRHAGTPITRVPVHYLKWMVNTGYMSGEARKELERRGTVTPEIDISGHALDRASLNCLDIWRKNRNQGEGLHAWLCRVSVEAIAMGEQVDGKYIWNGMKFAIETDCNWPVLKTVMRGNG